MTAPPLLEAGPQLDRKRKRKTRYPVEAVEAGLNRPSEIKHSNPEAEAEGVDKVEVVAEVTGPHHT